MKGIFNETGGMNYLRNNIHWKNIKPHWHDLWIWEILFFGCYTFTVPSTFAHLQKTTFFKMTTVSLCNSHPAKAQRCSWKRFCPISKPCFSFAPCRGRKTARAFVYAQEVPFCCSFVWLNAETHIAWSNKDSKLLLFFRFNFP